MSLFNKKKEDDLIDEGKLTKEEKTSTDKKSVPKSDKKSVSKVAVAQGDAQMAYKFIIKPWITEKTQELMASNKYVFRLRKKTTKKEAKIAIEKLYDVRVESVNMINVPSKARRFGRYTGTKSAVRKAIATLKKGDKIEIFE